MIASSTAPPGKRTHLRRPSARPASADEGIKAAKAAGFLVCTNTTIFKETVLDEIDALFAFLTRLGVDGFMLSPAYSYVAVKETNPEGAAEIDIRGKFKEADAATCQHDVFTL